MRRNHDGLNGFVDPGCSIQGELEFESSFRVDGRVKGTIRSRAELIVGNEGTVEGEIHVARCLIGGSVRGTVHATELVQLHPTAKVWGDINAPALVMEDGAFLEGRVATARPGTGHPDGTGRR